MLSPEDKRLSTEDTDIFFLTASRELNYFPAVNLLRQTICLLSLEIDRGGFATRAPEHQQILRPHGNQANSRPLEVPAAHNKSIDFASGGVHDKNSAVSAYFLPTDLHGMSECWAKYKFW
jgi:hypothetical protein